MRKNEPVRMPVYTMTVPVQHAVSALTAPVSAVSQTMCAAVQRSYYKARLADPDRCNETYIESWIR